MKSAMTMCFGLVCSCVGFGSGEVDLDSALTILERDHADQVTPEIHTALAQVGQGIPTADERAWARIKKLLDLDATPARIRIALFDSVLKEANARMAPDVAQLAMGWTGPLTGDLAPGSDRGKLQCLQDFLRKASKDSWPEWLATSPHTLPLIKRVAVNYTAMAGTAIELLGRLPLEKNVLQSAAEDIVLAQDRATEIPPRLLGLLGEASRARLRTAVEQSLSEGKLHWGAAAALASLGDQETRPLLERASTSASPKLQPYVSTMLWKVEVQNPPRRLLEYLQQAPPPEVSRYNWAIRRALELGLSRDEVRAALLAWFRTHGGADQHWRISMKRAALAAGVLSEQDVPEVVVPAVQPTP